MTLKRSKNSDLFLEILTSINKQIELSGKQNILSIHTHAESFYRDLLNTIFSLNLKNINEEEHNSPAIDLIDRDKKLVIQVTASCTKAKMEQTLDKSIIKELEENDYKLKFLFIGLQNERSKTWKPLNPHGIKFNPLDDVILTNDLFNFFLNLSIDLQEEVITLLYKEVGKSYIVNFSDINKLLDSSINSLGPRYTPEANIPTQNEKSFETLLDSTFFWKKLYSVITNLNVAFNNLLQYNPTSKEEQQHLDVFIKKTKQFHEILSSYNKNGPKEDSINYMFLLKDMICSLFEASDTYSLINSELKSSKIEKIRSLYWNINKEARELQIFFNEYNVNLLKKHILFITGEAGIGKSHMLADFCKKAVSDGHVTFLFLGQHFVSNINPWDQITNWVSTGASTHEFLKEIVRYSSSNSKKAIIVIDALNEGEGRQLWLNHIQKFIDELLAFPEIRLVCSIRATYLDSILPDNFIKQNNIATINHTGFESKEYDAAIEYCKYYDLYPPTLPLLGNEYRNPLFLKLVCTFLKQNQIKDLSRNYTLGKVFDNFITDINTTISKPIYLDYDKNINIVKIAILSIVNDLNFKYGSIAYNKAYTIISKATKDYCDNYKRILTSLIDENILNSSSDYNGNEIVYFSYDKIGDYYKAISMLEPFNKNTENLIDEISSSKSFTNLFSSNSSISMNGGLLESLAITMPEKLDIELFQIMPDEFQDEPSVIDYYIQSISWRQIDNLNEVVQNYLKNYVMKYVWTYNNFIDVLIKFSFESKSPYNANFLDTLLASYEMPFRDALWSSYISTNEELEKLIDWLWKHYASIPKDSLQLFELLLVWCFTSTNNQLRDKATKVLSCLIKTNPESALILLERFIEVDDMYISERLFASIYGSIVSSPSDNIWIEISDKIYNYIFDKHETYPHVLVRDYALSIINFCVSYYGLSDENYPKLLPPYNSQWYNDFPTNLQIDSFQKEIDDKYEKHKTKSSSIWKIIHSMTTEYGRGTGAYGDFGRYTFGYYVKDWENQFNDQDLSNIITYKILNEQYNVDLHSSFDRNVSWSSDRHNNRIERIGKKYQWIGTFELLARLVDNFPPYDEIKNYTDEYKNYLDKKSQSFLKFILKDLENNCELIDLDNANSNKLDSKFDTESDHIISTEKKYLPAPDINTSLTVRNIDPTFIFPKINIDYDKPIYPNFIDFINGESDWVSDNSIHSKLDDFRVLEIEGKEYIVLYSNISQKVDIKTNFPDADTITWLSASCFVEDSEVDNFVKNHLSINSNGVPYLEYSSCFLYDYYDSKSFIYQDSIHNTELDNSIIFQPSTQTYSWDDDSDKSLDNIKNSINIIIPSKSLVSYFNLKQTKNGIWEDNQGNIKCFDTTCLGYRNQLFLFDLELINIFLEKKNLTLMWGEYFEKLSKRHHHEWWQSVQKHKNHYTTNITDEREWKNDSKFL